MADAPGNLDSFERTCSALFGAALTCLAVRDATASGFRALTGAAAPSAVFHAFGCDVRGQLPGQRSTRIATAR